MKLEYEINASKEQLYDILLNAMVEDIKTNTNKDIEKKDVKEGYKYKKKIDNKKKNIARATIKHLKLNERYCLHVKSENGTTVIDYKLKAIDKNLTKVIYEETFTHPDGKVHDGFFYQRSLKKRVDNHFKNINKFIENNEK